jgi:hypothetical protein
MATTKREPSYGLYRTTNLPFVCSVGSRPENGDFTTSVMTVTSSSYFAATRLGRTFAVRPAKSKSGPVLRTIGMVIWKLCDTSDVSRPVCSQIHKWMLRIYYQVQRFIGGWRNSCPNVPPASHSPARPPMVFPQPLFNACSYHPGAIALSALSGRHENLTTKVTVSIGWQSCS